MSKFSNMTFKLNKTGVLFRISFDKLLYKLLSKGKIKKRNEINLILYKKNR